jgi:hypothetical protein
LAAALEAAQLFCQRVVAARIKETGGAAPADSRLSTGDFVLFFGTTHQFIQAAETATGGSTAMSLRATMLSQARCHLERVHDQQRERIIRVLDNETWTGAQVPRACQVVLDRLVDATLAKAGHGNQDSPHVHDEAASHAIVLDQRFTLVGASLVCVLVIERVFKSYSPIHQVYRFISVLDEYLMLANGLPPLVPDLVPKMLDLLRNFNQRVRFNCLSRIIFMHEIRRKLNYFPRKGS